MRGKNQRRKKTLREGEKWSDIHWNPLKYADIVSVKDKRENSKVKVKKVKKLKMKYEMKEDGKWLDIHPV